jgi:hypothetical protein
VIVEMVEVVLSEVPLDVCILSHGVKIVVRAGDLAYGLKFEVGGYHRRVAAAR